MGAEDVEEALPKFFEFNPDVVIIISPNTALPGPAKAREATSNRKLPGIVITDSPGKKVKADVEKQGLRLYHYHRRPVNWRKKRILRPN